MQTQNSTEYFLNFRIYLDKLQTYFTLCDANDIISTKTW